MRCGRHRRRGEGFTLLELMVAVAVLAIALIGVMQVVSQGLNTSRDAADRTVGSELAEQQLTEALMDPELQPGLEEGDFGDDYPRYYWTRRVESTDYPDLYRITVEVTWSSGTREHSVDLETCYCPGLLQDGSESTDQGQGATAVAPAAPSGSMASRSSS